MNDQLIDKSGSPTLDLMPQLNPRTFADAKQLGDNTFELILTNWGNRGAAADRNNGSIIFPPVAGAPGTGIVPAVPFPGGVADPLVRSAGLPSIMSIAISPRSVIDRCILQFDGLPQNKTTSITYVANMATVTEDPNVIRAGGMLETEMLLAPGAPYVGQLLGPVVIRADASSWYGDSYRPTGAALGSDSAPFGSALGTPDPAQNAAGGGAIWTTPELRVLVCLSGKQAPPPPLARAPLRMSFLAAPWAHPAPGPDQLLKVVPIAGRRHVSIAISTSAISGEGTFRITGVTSTIINGSLQNNEIDLDLDPVALGGDGNTGSTLINFVNEAPGVSWLLIHGQHTGGLNAVEASITIEAIDR
jgi:hypothetical protein